MREPELWSGRFLKSTSLVTTGLRWSLASDARGLFVNQPTAFTVTLLYERSRFTLPPRGHAIFGSIVAALGLVGWVAFAIEGKALFRYGAFSNVVWLGLLPLGLFFVAYGYWKRPVYQFYEDECRVIGERATVIKYDNVIHVAVDSIDYYIKHIIPFGTSHRLMLVPRSNDDPPVLFSVHTLSRRNSPLEQLVDHIRSRIPSTTPPT